MSNRTQLFVGCLHPDVTEEAISSLLKGKLSVTTRKCVVMRHRHSVGGSMSGKKGDSRGFGFITIDNAEVQRVKDAATTGELVLNDTRIVIKDAKLKERPAAGADSPGPNEGGKKARQEGGQNWRDARAGHDKWSALWAKGNGRQPVALSTGAEPAGAKAAGAGQATGGAGRGYRQATGPDGTRGFRMPRTPRGGSSSRGASSSGAAPWATAAASPGSAAADGVPARDGAEADEIARLRAELAKSERLRRIV